MPEYDAITPTQWVLFLWTALIIFSVLWWLFWRVGRTGQIERDEAGPVQIVERAWSALLHWRPSIMVHRGNDLTMAGGMEPVSIPVSQYDMDGGGMDESSITAPDIDAVNSSMPRVSRDITSDELIVLLAVLRGKDGKQRFSGNAIHTLVGGDRNTVMAKIKEIRSGPVAPVFPPLSQEQQQLREQLQLGKR